MSIKSRLKIIVSTLIISVGLDQYTKYLAREYLMERLGGYAWFDGFFRLIYAENEGAFLSLGSETTGWIKLIGLYIFPVVLLVGLFWYLLKNQSLSKSQILALSLVLGGGVSNIFDRLMFGKVVDFMVMGFEKLKTGVFNIADVAIMAGLFLLIFSRGARTKEVPADSPEKDQPNTATAADQQGNET
jgi:signal peptidase II